MPLYNAQGTIYSIPQLMALLAQRSSGDENVVPLYTDFYGDAGDENKIGSGAASNRYGDAIGRELAAHGWDENGTGYRDANDGGYYVPISDPRKLAQAQQLGVLRMIDGVPTANFNNPALRGGIGSGALFDDQPQENFGRDVALPFALSVLGGSMLGAAGAGAEAGVEGASVAGSGVGGGAGGVMEAGAPEWLAPVASSAQDITPAMEEYIAQNGALPVLDTTPSWVNQTAAPVVEMGRAASPADIARIVGPAAANGATKKDPTTEIGKQVAGAAATSLIGSAINGSTPYDPTADLNLSQEQLEAKKRTAMGNVDAAFKGFDDNYYGDLAKSYVDYQTPLLNDQISEARRALPLSFRSTANSAYARKAGNLERDYERAQVDIANQGQDVANQQRSSIEGERGNLMSQAEMGAGLDTSADQAASVARSLQQPPAFSPIGDLFAKYTANAANAKLAADAGFKPVRPLLFSSSPSRSVSNVR